MVAPSTDLARLMDSGDLTAAAAQMLGKMRSQLGQARRVNEKKYTLYEGRHQARNLDIAVPPHLADLEVFVGTPGIVVDVLAERIEWDGWSVLGGDSAVLDDAYRDDALDVEQARQAVDSLICGTSFVGVGTGDADLFEPDVVVSAESPMDATVLWDSRRRTESAGLIQRRDPVTSVVTAEVLYTPQATITLPRGSDGRSVDVQRDTHNLGVVPMVQFPNRERPSDIRGRSEITPPVRYATEAIGRTLLGMEINREFYTAPQRYGLGVDPAQFGIDEHTSAGEKLVKQWNVAMSRMNFIPAPENPGDPLPQIGQFTPAPPTPYIEQVKHYLQHVSAESAIPWNYLGFSTDNPPSAAAVRVLESRLVKRALLRQRMWTRAWRQVAYLIMKHRDPSATFASVSGVSPNWCNPATPTPASDADRASKLVGSKILDAQSKVTMREVGISERDQKLIEQERRQGTVTKLIDRLATSPVQEVPPPPQGAEPDLVDANRGR
ncbi:phage portal protein [Mycobacteroides sp. LB1]|uniref:phage portal protein n=1 Tax=Mycobacteroides sp. LB1 TaxID=2750814 RepID=UPI0015E0431C|nr:phage portal protein [Mycobacteroides sp. LB1]